VERLRRIDHLRFIQERSCGEMDNLCQSLQDRAFRGDF
jgi:hypothetical protein